MFQRMSLEGLLRLLEKLLAADPGAVYDKHRGIPAAEALLVVQEELRQRRLLQMV